MNGRSLACALALIALAVPSSARAGLADLDAGFGAGGIAVTDLGDYDSARAVAVDPAARILAAGSGTLADPARPGGTALTLVRLLPDGRQDPGFGVVQTDPGRYTAAFESVSVDAEGRIVAVGTATGFDGAGSNLIVARYLGDGTPDPAFGGNGLITLGGAGLWFGADSLVAGDRVLALAMTDGRGGMRPTLLGLRTDGTLDPSFGTGGQLRIVSNKLSSATSMAASGDHLIIGGTSSKHTLAAVRVAADGQIDRDWAESGFARVPFSGSSAGADLALDRRGRVLLAGSCSCTRGPSAAVARLRPGGGLDRRFDEDGRRTLRLGGKRSSTDAVALSILGRTPVLGVVVANGGDRRSALVALTSRGALDRDLFGDGVTSPGFGDGYAGDLVGDIVDDGRGGIIAAGTLFAATPDLVVARFVR